MADDRRWAVGYGLGMRAALTGQSSRSASGDGTRATGWRMEMPTEHAATCGPDLATIVDRCAIGQPATAAHDRWLSATELFAPGDDRLPAIVGAFGRRHGVGDGRIASAMWFRDYVVLVAGDAIRDYIACRLAADVALENLRLRFDEHGRPVAAVLRHARFAILRSAMTGGVGAVPLCDEVRLLAWLRRRLVDHHIAPAIDGLRGAAGVAADPLWDEAAAVCAEVFARAHAVSDCPARVLADAAAFFGGGSLLDGRGRFTVLSGASDARLRYVRARSGRIALAAGPAGRRGRGGTPAARAEEGSGKGRDEQAAASDVLDRLQGRGGDGVACGHTAPRFSSR